MISHEYSKIQCDAVLECCCKWEGLAWRRERSGRSYQWRVQRSWSQDIYSGAQ